VRKGRGGRGGEKGREGGEEKRRRGKGHHLCIT
jgi:hypothetical protein